MLFKVSGLVWEKSGGVWAARQTKNTRSIPVPSSVRCRFLFAPDTVCTRNSLRIRADRYRLMLSMTQTVRNSTRRMAPTF